MRSRLTCLLIVALVCACSPPPENAKPVPQKPKFQGWKDVAGGKMSPDGLFYSETGRFFAAFPGMPQHFAKDVDSPNGKLRMESYVYEESATMAYMVAYTDYPSKYVNAVGWEDLLNSAQSGALQSMSITGSARQKKLVINGYHGIDFRSNSDGKHIIARFLLVGNRLFQITMLSDGSYPADVLVDQFTNGFHMVLAGAEVEEDWWPEEMDSLEKANQPQ